MPRTKKFLPALVGVRLSGKDKALVEQAADLMGVSVSEWVRLVIMRTLREHDRHDGFSMTNSTREDLVKFEFIGPETFSA